MKKRFNLALNCLTCLVFVLMFFEINVMSAVKVIGFKYTYNGKTEDVCSYYLPSGEKIELEDREERLINERFVISRTKMTDSWAIRDFPKGYSECKHLPDESKTQVKLKKVDEFLKQEALAVPLVAIRNRDYFDAMSYVGAKVDELITNYDLTENGKQVYGQRLGRPRLRPMLSYLSYDIVGGGNGNLAIQLAAISETTNLHLYCHNYLIDNKNHEVNNNRLLTFLSCGQFFSDLSTKIVCDSNLESQTKINILDRLAKEVDLTYQGYALDQELNSIDYPKDYKRYIDTYKKRTSLMSGSMYGFSMWLSYIASGNYELAEQAYNVGNRIGVVLQMVNDLSDFSIKKRDAFSDWRLDKVTLPLYFLYEHKINEELTEDNLPRLLVSTGSYQKSIDVIKHETDLARAEISELVGSDSSLLHQVLVVSKDNKYFRQIRKA